MHLTGNTILITTQRRSCLSSTGVNADVVWSQNKRNPVLITQLNNIGSVYIIINNCSRQVVLCMIHYEKTTHHGAHWTGGNKEGKKRGGKKEDLRGIYCVLLIKMMPFLRQLKVLALAS